MQHAAVLNVAVRTHGDALVVTAQDCAPPDARIGLEQDVADDHGRLCDPVLTIGDELFVPQAIDHGHSVPAIASVSSHVASDDSRCSAAIPGIPLPARPRRTAASPGSA